jgi:hypothetical protein
MFNSSGALCVPSVYHHLLLFGAHGAPYGKMGFGHKKRRAIVANDPPWFMRIPARFL